MTGTPGQIEWAKQIKIQVNAEFERVAGALESAARKQSEKNQADTYAVITILQRKRAEVMARQEADYFIRVWQGLRDQVRQMIVRDPGYQEMRARRQIRGQDETTQTGGFAVEAGIQLMEINVKFTAKELELLSRLATDQLFRREFIDSRMHGYKSDADELDLGKRLVERLRAVMDRAPQTAHPRKNGSPV